MILTYPFSSVLNTAILAATTRLPARTGQASLVADFTGNHGFATIYTATRSERVMVTVSGGQLQMIRGTEGTEARGWPEGSCLRFDAPVEGVPCPDEDTSSACDVSGVLGRLRPGKGITIDFTDPNAPIVGIAPTGVSPANIGCGAEVNECGQITFAPAGWPATCMNNFNPCCDSTSTAGPVAVDACDVTYTTMSTANIVTGDTVCEALTQLEDAISSGGSSGGMVGVTAGRCVEVTGAASSPTIGLPLAGISAGVYDGFSVNECGIVTGYAAPAQMPVRVEVKSPMDVTLRALDNTYVIEIAEASTSGYGVTRLAKTSDAMTNPSPALPFHVVSVEFLEAWATARGI
jgi:hypothetical protein